MHLAMLTSHQRANPGVHFLIFFVLTSRLAKFSVNSLSHVDIPSAFLYSAPRTSQIPCESLGAKALAENLHCVGMSTE
ncbi:hypothetical protein M433DRAFT_507939 [Acidomyces richmondensis BFW]|nr:MAG: hypothetical protein FE78DRAFT_398947 [Acidomyces sp. 'richmondensis']KYG41044.1 hypothetical protein M433DRAFT_507939 [Acidomyces richmondensis BFW]